MALGKQFSRRSTLSSYKFSNTDLSRILRVLTEINRDANPGIYNHLKNGDGTSFSQFHRLKTEIYGDNGEYFVSFDPQDLQIGDLPKKITRVVIDNYGLPIYLNNISSDRTDGFFVPNTFKLTLDFTSVDIFDFSARPSDETSHLNQLIVEGQTENWTKGTFATIVDELSGCQVINRILHRRNLYDFILFVIVYPILILLLIKNNDLIRNATNEMSSAVVAVAFLIALLALTYCYRILFNWTRWLFPINELTFQIVKFRFLQKAVFAFLILSIISAIVGNLVTK